MAKGKAALKGAIETDIQTNKEQTLLPRGNNIRGKRGDKNYASICAQVPKDLKMRFRVAITERETNNNDVIEKLIEDWLTNLGK